MEVVLVLDPGRVPDGVAFLLTKVGYLAADLELSFDGRRGLLARGALPVVLQLPVSFLAFVDAGSVLRAVYRDQVLGFAAGVLDFVPLVVNLFFYFY